MVMSTANRTRQKLTSLEQHLRNENPLLVDAVKSFRRLDRVGRRMGLLGPDQSYATQIPWWPLVSVLGTFSAGKSTFINHFLGTALQRTGTQAVDDKFTVICYASDGEMRELPGLALDADPRFPFYQMSEELEKVVPGEGHHVDGYLRLKTCPSERLRGTILIDSPGFDADAQRSATLRITDYIMDLSDLVLVFFDARHPEPGAMQDTLMHLVANTIRRPDAGKFVFVLNQIDAAAREDNPEDVVAAWQRALAQEGLTAGRFYAIYSPEVELNVPDDALRQRFESKRDADLAEIHARIQQVGVERAYRIIGALDKTARVIEEQRVPRLRDLLQRWRRGVWWRDGVLLLAAVAVLIGASVAAGYWQGLQFDAPAWLIALFGSPQGMLYTALVVLFVAFWLHFSARRWSANSVRRHLIRRQEPGEEREQLLGAFSRSTRAWRSVLTLSPAGWNRRAARKLRAVQAEADDYVQHLNDCFTNPSGTVPAADAVDAEASPRDHRQAAGAPGATARAGSVSAGESSR